MNAGIIGFGSIGMRHARILSGLCKRVAVVSSRLVDHPLLYSSIKELSENEQLDYLVVANKTVDHNDAISQIDKAGYKGILLVEKPLFSHHQTVSRIHANGYVGYNLRFHPVLQKLRNELLESEVLSAHVYVGQYLPRWRPQADYRKSYSAKQSEGGGVLRDLSHELDYMNWLFGGWTKVAAQGGKLSDLEIDSDDHYSMLLSLRRCPNAIIHMNYLDHIGQRRIVVNTNSTTYIADLGENTLQINNETLKFNVERDDTYISMHQALLQGDHSTVCTFEEAIDTMKLIEAAERANSTGEWIEYA